MEVCYNIDMKFAKSYEPGEFEPQIYAEWENNGVFDNGLFNSWDEYYAAFFNPDIELLCVRVIN